MKAKPKPEFDTSIKQAILRVDRGRGFVIEDREEQLRWPPPPKREPPLFRDRRLVITAAHCLPHLPKPEQLGDDAIYRNLLGTLESTKLGVWAECLFADPVGDVAVLGVPDNQRFEDQADAYEELTSSVPALRVKNARRKQQAWLLGLDDEWISSRVDRMSKCLALDLDPTPGMSGSPIVASDGAAIGVVNVGGGMKIRRRLVSPRQAVLWDCLPNWLLRSLAFTQPYFVLNKY